MVQLCDSIHLYFVLDWEPENRYSICIVGYMQMSMGIDIQDIEAFGILETG